MPGIGSCVWTFGVHLVALLERLWNLAPFFLCFSCVLMKCDPAASCLATSLTPHTPAVLPGDPFLSRAAPASVFWHSSRKIVNKITLDVSPFEVQLWLLKPFSWPHSSFLQNKISDVNSCSFYTSEPPPQPSGWSQRRVLWQFPVGFPGLWQSAQDKWL